MLFGMNTQAQYDFVVRHLLSQKKRSMIDGRCAFEDAQGNRCANGAFLQFLPAQPPVLNNWWAYIVGQMTPEEIRLHQLLRIVHDAVEPKFWVYALRGVALVCGLTPTVDAAIVFTAIELDENQRELAALLEEIGDTRVLV